MSYELWDSTWLQNAECTTENFVRLIISGEKSEMGRDHRKRLKTIIQATWEQYLGMRRIHTHCAIEEEIDATKLWLSQPNPVLVDGENIYQRFYRRVRQNMMERARKKAGLQLEAEINLHRYRPI